jgi:hypothetical protein
MVEQRCVIKFFADESELGVEIHRRLKDHYVDDAVTPSEVYRWIRDIKGGRTGPETIPRPDEGLSKGI